MCPQEKSRRTILLAELPGREQENTCVYFTCGRRKESKAISDSYTTRLSACSICMTTLLFIGISNQYVYNIRQSPVADQAFSLIFLLTSTAVLVSQILDYLRSSKRLLLLVRRERTGVELIELGILVLYDIWPRSNLARTALT